MFSVRELSFQFYSHIWYPLHLQFGVSFSEMGLNGEEHNPELLLISQYSLQDGLAPCQFIADTGKKEISSDCCGFQGLPGP